jgi:F-type H+-transporting ATPase subunit epsilon
MAKLHLQLVTPQRVVLNEELDSVSCPTVQGQITVLPGHIPLVATLKPGELVARNGQGEHNIHVDGGFVEIKSGNQVVILADAAEHIAELDETKIQQAAQRAKELLQQSNASDEEYALAAASLEKNLSRLRILRKHAHRTQRPVTSEGILHEE